MTDHQEPGDPNRFAKRDAETQMMLGGFVTLISIPVLIGTFWADTTRAAVVNVAAGAILFAIGLGIAVYGWRKGASS